MFSLQEHIEAEAAHWQATRQYVPDDEESSTATSAAQSEHCKYGTRHLSRRSSTSSFATEFEPEPEAAQPFMQPRDFNGTPITVYASFEAAVAQRTWPVDEGPAQEPQEQQPRRLSTPGKLYENEEDDDEIVYE